MMLLVAIVTGAKATELVERYQYPGNGAVENGYFTKFTLGKGAAYNSRRIKVSNGETGTFTVSTNANVSALKIKTIELKEYSSNKISALKVNDVALTKTDGKYTYTAGSNETSVTFTMSASGGNGEISEVAITLTDGNNDDCESLIPVSGSQGAIVWNSTLSPSLATITGSTSNVKFATSNGTSVIEFKQNDVLTVSATRAIKAVYFSYTANMPSLTVPAGTTYNATTHCWTPANTNTKSVSFTKSDGSTTRISNIYIVYQAAGPVDPVLTISKEIIGTNETAKILLGGEDTFGDNFTAGTLWESAEYGPYVTLSADGTITPIKATPEGYYFTFTATAKDTEKYNTVTGKRIDITITNPTCVTPTISPATFTADDQEVTIATETEGATIYYTTDGTEPTTSSSAYDAENKPTISSTTTFKAIAVKDGYDNSAVATQKVTRTASALVGDWDFTNWSAATQAGAKGDTDAWNQYEKSNSGGMDFGENGRSNVSAISEGSTLKYSTTNIEETDGLTFKADAYGLGLIFNIGSATVSSTEYTYQGSSYLWLYNKNAVITIPSVPAGATIEIGVESHNGGSARGVTLKNGSTTLTQTQGEATSTEYQVCKWTNATAGNVTVTPSAGLHIYYIKVTGNAETVPVATSAGNTYATYVTQNDLDFSSVSDDITAYITKTANAESTSIPTEVVTKVPAGTAILVKTAEAGATVNVPVAASTPAALTANTMQYSDSEVAGDGTTIFAFFKVSGQYGFAPVKTGTSLAAGKGYIVIPEGNSGNFLPLDFAGEATAIDNVNANDNANNAGVKKYFKNGQFVIETANGVFTAAGAQIK